MSKTITSPVKRFAGEVVLADPLTFPQVFAFEDAIATAQSLGDGTSFIRQNSAILPGVFACVEEWHLNNFPERPSLDNFPATPIAASAQLVAWLVKEISALFSEAETVPNA